MSLTSHQHLNAAFNFATTEGGAKRVLFVDPSNEGGVDWALSLIDVWDQFETREAGDKYLIQLGIGTYSGEDFTFADYTDVDILGMGEGTVVTASPDTFANKWAKCVNFSGNVRCSMGNFKIKFTDDGSANAHENGAIMRHPDKASNSTTGAGLRGCRLFDIDIEVEEMDSGRTNDNAIIWGIGYLGGDGGGTGTHGYALQLKNVNVLSSCSGVVIGDGEWQFENCNIWFGNTDNTNTPDLVGLDNQRAGRWYWWNGKNTTGYSADASVDTDADVYCVRANNASTGGRGFIWGMLAFARNEASSPGNTRAVYMNDENGGNGWLRFENCFLQAEVPNSGGDVPAVSSDWDPVSLPTTNRIELYGNRVAGIAGNALGPDGHKTVSSSVSFSSHWILGETFVDTSGGDVTITMHSNDPVNNEWGYIKNYTGSNDVTIAVASGDYLDNVVDNTVVVPPGHTIKIKAYKLDGSDKLYFETAKFNYEWELVDHFDITAVSQIDVTTGFSSGYDTRIVLHGVQPQTGGSYLRLRMSNDSGSTFESGATDYSTSASGGCTAGNEETAATTGATDCYINMGTTTNLLLYHTANNHMSVELEFPDPTNTGLKPLYFGRLTGSLSGSHVAVQHCVGRRNAAQTCDAVRFFFDTGYDFVAQGRIEVYQRKII